MINVGIMYELPTLVCYRPPLTESYYYIESKRNALQFMRGVFYEKTDNIANMGAQSVKCINSVGIVYFLAIFNAIFDYPTLIL